MLAKQDRGCRFFITQSVYDADSTKSLLSDYALESQATDREPVPVVLTFSPCGSVRTLQFMKWLGISFPRWLENELRHSADTLERSIDLCENVFADVQDYARETFLFETLSSLRPPPDRTILPTSATYSSSAGTPASAVCGPARSSATSAIGSTRSRSTPPSSTSPTARRPSPRSWSRRTCPSSSSRRSPDR